jgi:hypothetical protein
VEQQGKSSLVIFVLPLFFHVVFRPVQYIHCISNHHLPARRHYFARRCLSSPSTYLPSSDAGTAR